MHRIEVKNKKVEKSVIILWNIAYILIATSCDYTEV